MYGPELCDYWSRHLTPLSDKFWLQTKCKQNQFEMDKKCLKTTNRNSTITIDIGVMVILKLVHRRVTR